MLKQKCVFQLRGKSKAERTGKRALLRRGELHQDNLRAFILHNNRLTTDSMAIPRVPLSATSTSQPLHHAVLLRAKTHCLTQHRSQDQHLCCPAKPGKPGKVTKWKQSSEAQAATTAERRLSAFTFGSAAPGQML